MKRLAIAGLMVSLLFGAAQTFAFASVEQTGLLRICDDTQSPPFVSVHIPVGATFIQTAYLPGPGMHPNPNFHGIRVRVTQAGTFRHPTCATLPVEVDSNSAGQEYTVQKGWMFVAQFEIPQGGADLIATAAATFTHNVIQTAPRQRCFRNGTALLCPGDIGKIAIPADEHLNPLLFGAVFSEDPQNYVGVAGAPTIRVLVEPGDRAYGNGTHTITIAECYIAPSLQGLNQFYNSAMAYRENNNNQPPDLWQTILSAAKQCDNVADKSQDTIISIKLLHIFGRTTDPLPPIIPAEVRILNGPLTGKIAYIDLRDMRKL